MYPLFSTVKETDLMPIAVILQRTKVGPVALLVASSFIASRIFKTRTQNYFHVVLGHISRSM